MNTKDLQTILTLLRDYDVGQVKLKMGEIELECTFNKALTTASKLSNPGSRFTVPGSPPEKSYAFATLSAADQNDLSVLGPALGFTPKKVASVVRKSEKD